MHHYVGLDVSLEQTFVCAVDQDGNRVWEGKVSSTPKAMSHIVRAKAPLAKKVVLESGPLSTWHYHALKNCGLPVVCIDARHAKAALSMQVNKTDANDAHGLAQIARTGWHNEVRVKSIDSHMIRTLIVSRSQLVGIRTKLSNHLRGIFKTFGMVLGKAGGRSLFDQARDKSTGNLHLGGIVESIHTVWTSVCEQIQAMDITISTYSSADKTCQRLMTIPGVGSITALAFMAVIDDPKRFAKSSSVGAYLGLTPRRYQSGEMDYNGRITKCGDKLMRILLYQAANVLIERVNRWSKLKAWAMGVAKKRGKRRAKVALARKIAVIMHRMWLDGSSFRWTDKEAAA